MFTAKFNADSFPNQKSTGVSNPIVVEQRLQPISVGQIKIAIQLNKHYLSDHDFDIVSWNGSLHNAR